MLSKFNGYKTYVLATVGIIYAISGVATGNLDMNHAMTIIWAALVAAGIRHGVSTGA